MRLPQGTRTESWAALALVAPEAADQGVVETSRPAERLPSAAAVTRSLAFSCRRSMAGRFVSSRTAGPTVWRARSRREETGDAHMALVTHPCTLK